MPGFEGKKKKKKSRHRRGKSLAAAAAGRAELCAGSMPAQTPTPARAGVPALRDPATRTGHVCTHVRMHTHTGGGSTGTGVPAARVCTQQAARWARGPQPHAVGPALPPPCRALLRGGERLWSPLRCARGVLASLSLNPARTNEAMTERISLLAALSLLLAKICPLASSQACPSVFALFPALPCHHL